MVFNGRPRVSLAYRVQNTHLAARVTRFGASSSPGLARTSPHSASLIRSLAQEDKQTARRHWLYDSIGKSIHYRSWVSVKPALKRLVIGQARHVISVLFWYGLLGGTGAFLFISPDCGAEPCMVSGKTVFFTLLG
ncbi:hypothetical protein P4S72_24385 [Vibrio sp. PP-XX7]